MNRQQRAIEFFERILEQDIIIDLWKGCIVLVNDQRALIKSDENDDYPDEFKNGTLFFVCKVLGKIEADVLRDNGTEFKRKYN